VGERAGDCHDNNDMTVMIVGTRASNAAASMPLWWAAVAVPCLAPLSAAVGSKQQPGGSSGSSTAA
jgi:hypothetical protein